MNWDVVAEGGGYGSKDGYGAGQALASSLQETRNADHTINNIQVQLPKGSIKIDRDINAQVVQVQAPAPAYRAPAPAAYKQQPVY